MADHHGFSDAADLFVFISGYTAALAYSKAMRHDGFWAGAVKLMRRVWQLYVAHILLFVVYVASHRLGRPSLPSFSPLGRIQRRRSHR